MIQDASMGQVAPRRRPIFYGAIIAGFCISCLAVSNQSFWIDEISTAHKAMMPTLGGWWERMRAEGTSNLQLPLYLLYAWAWEKAVGLKEWALRAGNIPWMMLAAAILYKSFRKETRLQTMTTCALLFNAFAWYYLNEARPYAMQIGASFLTFGALYRLSVDSELDAKEQQWWSVALSIGSPILCASGLMAMIWCGAALAGAALAWPPGRFKKLWSAHSRQWSFTGVVLIGLACYYVWTMTIGARATVLGTTNITNALFILYELLGLGGLGPGRLAIRAEGLAAFRPFLPVLVVQSLLVTVVVGAGLRRLWGTHDRKALLKVCLSIVAAAAFLLVVGRVAGFRVLGRHFAPMLSICAFVSALGCVTLWQRRSRLSQSVVVSFFVLSVLSCLSVRFCARHAKDDYRGAAKLAKMALERGENVWWDADPQSPVVYGVPAAHRPGETGKALLLFNPATGFDDGLSPPDLVLASRPDVYDADGALRDYIVRHGYRESAALRAFTAWRKNN